MLSRKILDAIGNWYTRERPYRFGSDDERKPPFVPPPTGETDGWLRRVDEGNGINISLLFRVYLLHIPAPPSAALPLPRLHHLLPSPSLLHDMAASFGGSFAAAAAVVALLLTSAQAVQHIVGDDHGWDVSSDVAAWTIDRVFRVGDNICKIRSSLSLSLPFFC